MGTIAFDLGIDGDPEAAITIEEHARTLAEPLTAVPPTVLRVPAQPVAAHIRRLVADGWQKQHIAAQAGISFSSIRDIIGRDWHGKGQRKPPRETVASDVAQRILAIPLAANVDGWEDRAACLGSHPGLFFPEKGSGDAKRAKEVCARCPVRTDCLEAHIDERFGIWGGTSEIQRRRLRIARKAAA